MNGFNLSTASNITIGSATVSAVYLGSQKIWPVQSGYDTKYLTIKTIGSNGYLCCNNRYGIDQAYYSKDGGTTWNAFPAYTLNWKLDTSVPISASDEVILKCVQTNTDRTQHLQIHCTVNYSVSGNVMSMIYGDNFISYTSTTLDYALDTLFTNETNLRYAYALSLPATTLSNYCYRDMFHGCTSLTSTPPQLPATTMSPWCYDGMFSGCTSLRFTPDLPATTLAIGCYSGMFTDCTNIRGCTLPATTLAESCYSGMFQRCDRFNALYFYATDVSPLYCVQDMLTDAGAATAGGTLYVRSSNIQYDPYAIVPSDWFVIPYS